MMASREQYFFASGWLWKGWCIAWVFTCVGAALYMAVAGTGLHLGWGLVFWILIVGGIATLVGLLSASVSFIIFGPFLAVQAEINGAPFHVGDRVRILSGRCRDHITRVSEVWEAPGLVRVDIEQTDHSDSNEVYSELQVCRET